MSSPFGGTYPIAGIPEVGVDVPASAVLLAVYFGLGIFHAVGFFKLSKKMFIPQAMVMGFCFSRVVTEILRISWTTHLTNKNLAIAANVFVNAGVLLLYVVNLIFLHRFTLQLFPSIPSHKKHPVNFVPHAAMWSILPLLLLVIVPGVQLFLSSDMNTIDTDRIIIRVAQCYLTAFVAVQVPLVVVVWALYMLSPNKRSGILADEVTVRAAIIFAVAVLLTWIQTVKILQTFYVPTPQTPLNPPWFLRRPILYSGFFLPELLCVIIYAATSIQLRFIKPVRGAAEGEQKEGRGKVGEQKMDEGHRERSEQSSETKFEPEQV